MSLHASWSCKPTVSFVAMAYFCLAFFVWQEMERRKQQQSDNAASSARNYFSAQTQAESARQQAAFDAAQRSRQILEEEKAKDRAWREAVLKVSSCLCKCHLVLMSLSVLSASCMCVSVRHKQLLAHNLLAVRSLVNAVPYVSQMHETLYMLLLKSVF